MSGAGETNVEMVQRHVREGLERLERHRALISAPIRHDNYSFAPAARRFLAEIEKYHAELEDELEKLLRDER